MNTVTLEREAAREESIRDFVWHYARIISDGTLNTIYGFVDDVSSDPWSTTVHINARDSGVFLLSTEQVTLPGEERRWIDTLMEYNREPGKNFAMDRVCFELLDELVPIPQSVVEARTERALGEQLKAEGYIPPAVNEDEDYEF